LQSGFTVTETLKHKITIMNKLIYVLTFLLTTQLYSQKEKGTITLLDGTVISGYVKANDNSFKFKESENSESVKFDYKKAKSATIVNSEGGDMIYEFVYVDYQKKPLLLAVVIDGFMRLYGDSTMSFTGGTGAGTGFRGSSTYHIKRKKDEIGQYFIAYGYIPKVGFKKVIENYFTDCPQIHAKVKKGDFGKDDFKEIVEFYNQNCSPK
jgi:hypothetical protein